MEVDAFCKALDDAIDCPEALHLPRSDRLALAVWWLVNRVGGELRVPASIAAAHVAIASCVAAESMDDPISN